MPGRAAFAGAAAACLVGLASCRPPDDRLHALPLERPPAESDWDGAVALRVEARGGRTSRPGDGDVDADAVHAATASCHHGTGGAAVALSAKAFYTPERLYLRLEWTDPTDDRGPVWRWQGRSWAAAQGAEDGVALLWGRPGEAFSCERACHLRDWRMAAPRSFADYGMRSGEGAPSLDLWIWKAGRGRLEGTAEDARIGHEGREGDSAGELFAPNSLRARAGEPGPFGPGDAPRLAPDPAPGVTAPGWVVLGAPDGRLEVDGVGTRVPGGWRVTLSRRLDGTDPEDVRAASGTELLLGVATLDAVSSDHNAVPRPIRLVLVDPAALAVAKE